MFTCWSLIGYLFLLVLTQMSLDACRLWFRLASAIMYFCSIILWAIMPDEHVIRGDTFHFFMAFIGLIVEKCALLILLI